MMEKVQQGSKLLAVDHIRESYLQKRNWETFEGMMGLNL